MTSVALTRAPMAYFFPTLPADEGSISPTPPRSICQTTWPIRDTKTVFDSPRLELSEYATQFYLNITDDVKCRVKACFFICRRWFLRAKQTRLTQSRSNGMDRVWDASKYPLQLFVTLCQIKDNQGHEVKRCKIWNFAFCGVIHDFGLVFRQGRNEWP